MTTVGYGDIVPRNWVGANDGLSCYDYRNRFFWMGYCTTVFGNHDTETPFRYQRPSGSSNRLVATVEGTTSVTALEKLVQLSFLRKQ
jgi:hypothetical protein